MPNTQSLNDLLTTRYGRATDPQPTTQLAKPVNPVSEPTSSIELTQSKPTNNSSIELPEAITSLVTGSDYWKRAKLNRYRMLARQGYLPSLLTLAEEALKAKNPANWYAKVCSKAQWESRTLTYLKRLEEVKRKAQAVANRLKTEVSKFMYKQVWSGVNVQRWADIAAETAHAKPGQTPAKYFAWLCKHGDRVFGAAA